jgi:pimeloyl-ACP methyl ester carboxylesterase
VQIDGPHGRLDVEIGGPVEGEAVLMHSGTPGAGRLFALWVDAGAERGLRHVAYSRPGYGDSARHAGRSVADCAADVAAVADALGLERFFTVGASGGGPHALACAALLPERVLSAATIGGVAPAEAEGLDWLAGMGEENVVEFGAAREGEAALRRLLEREAEHMIATPISSLHAAFGDLVSEVDREALTEDFAAYLHECLRLGLAHGIDGWLDDDFAFMRDWGFELADITRPVTVWHGLHDRFVPPAHGEWLAAHVRGAHAQLLADQGHLSLALASYGEILDGLVASGR